MKQLALRPTLTQRACGRRAEILQSVTFAHTRLPGLELLPQPPCTQLQLHPMLLNRRAAPSLPGLCSVPSAPNTSSSTKLQATFSPY